jgi:hypothetical protein
MNKNLGNISVAGQTSEQIFCIRHILQGRWERNGIVHQLLQASRKKIFTCVSDFRRGFGSVSRFIWSSPGGTTINYNTFNLTVTTTLRNYEHDNTLKVTVTIIHKVHISLLTSSDFHFSSFCVSAVFCLSLSLMLRPTISRPVCLGIKHSSGAYDQIFITVRQLRICWCGALSLTRGRVRRLQLLLVFASEVIFGSQSRETSDHILLSQIRTSAVFCSVLTSGYNC